MGNDNVSGDGTAERIKLDPMTWQVPLVCQQCARHFEVPYRHFEAGVVFHCLHCRASFVPKTTICRIVRDAFEEFRQARTRASEAARQKGNDQAALARVEQREYDAFILRIEHLVDLRPRIKMMRKH
ncbi:MAG: hypothetical protein ACREQE_05925 [Candidatus Binataceae bacterium]